MSPERLLEKATECERQGLDRMVLMIPRRKRISATVTVLPPTPERKRVMGKVIGAKSDELFVSVRASEVTTYLSGLTTDLTPRVQEPEEKIKL